MTAGDPSKAPHVINNSWGCPKSEGCEGSEMLDAMKALQQAGIMVVASAGNEGAACKTIADQPASITDAVFSVGATNHLSGRITAFSSRGPSALTGGIGPDVTAPGEGIRSAIPGGAYEGGWSGTSMAAPHVAGLAALVWSAQPKLIGRISETIELIRKTAIGIKTNESCGGVSGKQIPNNTYGYGSIDAYKTVKAAIELP